ncbi:MAG: LPS export ABC transporter ATP-binding protein [Bdellovibrionales bacterium CG10_big_fil_rev_8_21_14_0_10_45_34]|nr:MAG: LPS export ABC transporter ATP-binding protein [Bdellovibrionales bacterium CG10_big_fil_rev_8_21_14_0_10_45_34]
MSEARIDAKSLSKSYRGRKVVDNVTFHVCGSEIVGLLGPNGAGKTTSFYMVVGLVQPDDGEIDLNGANVTDAPMFQRARLGVSYLAQEASVFRRLTVRENLYVALEAIGLSGGDRDARAEELLEEFKIGHISDSMGYSLSGGERRRVEIARAIATEPSFLLLDEPFAGIDPIAVGDLQSMIKSLKAKGLGILITDHNVRETLTICDRGYILKEGQIQVEGTSEDIANSEIAKKFYLGENFRL